MPPTRKSTRALVGLSCVEVIERNLTGARGLLDEALALSERFTGASHLARGAGGARALAGARPCLGEAAMVQAWNSGQALSTQQAFQCARAL